MDDRKTQPSPESGRDSRQVFFSGRPWICSIASLALIVLLIIAALQVSALRNSPVRQPIDAPPQGSVAKMETVSEPSFDDPELAAPLLAERIPSAPHDGRIAMAGYYPPNPKARVLIVRGIFTVFSLGMDDLAAKLRQRGYAVQVSTAAQSNYAAKRLRDYVIRANDRTPVIIIGHSLGGDLAPRLARTFAEKNVPVDMLIMLDSTMPSSPPANVRRCVNLYQSNLTPDWAPVFRGSRIDHHADQTELYNIDIRKLASKEKTSGINHFNIDANPWIHDLILEAVQYANGHFGPIHGQQYRPVRGPAGRPGQARATEPSRRLGQPMGGYPMSVPRRATTSLNPQQYERRN